MEAQVVVRLDRVLHLRAPRAVEGERSAVPDNLVDKWVRGLPGIRPVAIVSLLGRKPDGLSEFSFYSFAGAFERPAERKGRPLFIDWLLRRHPACVDRVIEHPTTDFKRIDVSTLAAVAADIEAYLRRVERLCSLIQGARHEPDKCARTPGSSKIRAAKAIDRLVSLPQNMLRRNNQDARKAQPRHRLAPRSVGGRLMGILQSASRWAREAVLPGACLLLRAVPPMAKPVG